MFAAPSCTTCVSVRVNRHVSKKNCQTVALQLLPLPSNRRLRCEKGIPTRMPFFVYRTIPLPKIIFDPEQLPVVAVGGEAALDAERLTPAWLRQRFASPAPWQPDPPESWVARPTMTAASVLLPLVQRPD